MAPCCGLSELKTKKFYVTLLAEFLGTMFLVLVACGSALAPAGATLTLASQDVAATCGATTIQIALGFGFSVATMVWATAHVSGGHINPAVSFGFVVTRKISWIRFIFYVIMQAAGATLGAALLKGLVPDAGSIGTSQLSGVSRGQGFGMELLITFVLVFTVFASVDGGRGDIGGSVPLTIGVSIAMCHLWAVPFTGAGMNPARVFGPALISSTWDDHWIYWLAPLLGGAAAALLYDFIFAVNATPTKVAGFATADYDNDNYDKVGRRTAVTSATELKA